jgi:hypothetical protein
VRENVATISSEKDKRWRIVKLRELFLITYRMNEGTRCIDPGTQRILTKGTKLHQVRYGEVNKRSCIRKVSL